MKNERISDVFKYLKQDALAGTVTGIMAVPLTVGICLMSDYPVMTGLYTVIFACIIGFVSYLFKPGNYVGTPGVAAGLAPALALGVSSFGMENMPFVIFLTSVFQAIVWKFKLERFILKMVPHYLVEGLLAGVGLKIMLKFFPFLYEIEHETDHWLSLEREIIIILSIVSFISFVWLYKAYKKKLPALPYVIIVLTSIGLSFFMPLPMLELESVPFQLVLPLPNFSGIDTAEIAILMAEMVGFSIMLGSIDVIEQVMSNVAIEKLDPLKRECDSNNSLQAIWLGNMGATFFGGMTNLDGLAKSTTNAVAGAVTKLSNIFTVIVLLIVVAFPAILNHMPVYALGIIMVYSGWKMIANLSHVKADGRYALMLSGICGLVVFKLGIFEGLLLILGAHTIIQIIFMLRIGKSIREVWNLFKDFMKDDDVLEIIDGTDVVREPEVPVLVRWKDAVNFQNIEQLRELYGSEATMLSSFAKSPKISLNEIEHFYAQIFERMHNLSVEILDAKVKHLGSLRIDSGHYKVRWGSREAMESDVFRFSMVINENLIIEHHSSKDPEDDIFGL